MRRWARSFHGGAILAHPKIVTVTFEGDTNGAAYAAFDEALGPSTWWQKALLHYGISPAVVDATVGGAPESCSLT